MTQTSLSLDPARFHPAVLTRHARKRSQQRGIPARAITLIRSYGERSHDGRGGVRYTMTGRAMDKLIRAIGRDQSIDRLGGCYVVQSLDAAAVITVGHRTS